MIWNSYDSLWVLSPFSFARTTGWTILTMKVGLNQVREKTANLKYQTVMCAIKMIHFQPTIIMGIKMV